MVLRGSEAGFEMHMAPCVVVAPYYCSYFPNVLPLKQYRNPTTLKFFLPFITVVKLFSIVGVFLLCCMRMHTKFSFPNFPIFGKDNDDALWFLVSGRGTSNRSECGLGRAPRAWSINWSCETSVLYKKMMLPMLFRGLHPSLCVYKYHLCLPLSKKNIIFEVWCKRQLSIVDKYTQ